MVFVNCNKFTASDLVLFIESMEQITRLESLKRKRQQSIRARYLADTLRYLSQQYPAYSSSTLTYTDRPEEESVMESFEEKRIAIDTSCLMQPNQYEVIDRQSPKKFIADDSVSCHTTIYSLPYECVASTRIEDVDYETLELKSKAKTDRQYDKPTLVMKKLKVKCPLVNMMRKNYKKCFGKKSSEWHKSESWTRLSVV